MGCFLLTGKLDRRKKYTRMVLKESLISLLKEKPITAITVKEICVVADINRSTFYSHFSDPYDLLYKIEEEILVDMNKTLSNYNYNKEEETLQMTEKLLQYVAENKDICQTLLSEHGDASFQNRIMKLAHESILQNIISDTELDAEILEYISLFAISGSIFILKSWLENGTDKSPKEMAEIITKLTNKGLSSFT